MAKGFVFEFVSDTSKSPKILIPLPLNCLLARNSANNENHTETYGSSPKPDRAKPESCAVDKLFGLGSQIYYFHDQVAKDSNRDLLQA